MYSLEIKPELEKKLAKLFKKSKKQYEIIIKKTQEILQNPQHYKNLRAPLQYLKEVHIDKHFVLTFSVNEQRKIVTLEDYAHHTEIFKE
ncbi:hypothetical protein HZA98_03840 [Candidatus Woesearchaeota archaeon]|nr:hypothetical protein [Candidatus Woesearchaeota archaeon]